jgi:hypothetical protein
VLESSCLQLLPCREGRAHSSYLPYELTYLVLRVNSSASFVVSYVEANVGTGTHAGSWWAEYLPFFSAADIAVLAQQSGGSKVPLPADFEESNERLRGIYCLHCPLLDISGATTFDVLA